MATIKADEMRIPRRAREAVAQHEQVIVMNRERPAFVISHPDDRREAAPSVRGRPLSDALARLAQAPVPDADFATDMEAVLQDVGRAPADPWGTLLDTTVFIEFERATRAASGEHAMQNVTRQLEEHLGANDEVAIASITASELLHGVHREATCTAHGAKEAVLAAFPALPFDLLVARTHARL